MKVFLLLPFLILTTQGCVSDQPEPKSPGDGSRQETLAALASAAREITDSASVEIRSKESWTSVQDQRRLEMRDMLGLLPWPARTPLNARITGALEGDSFTVEKLAFESLPKVFVTANLFLPEETRGRVPAVVYVCGHAYSPYGNKIRYQRHGISLAKNGYVALIIDSIQIAETFALHHGVSGQQMPEWYSRGYTPGGVEVWNAMRGVDYLLTRPEVDPERIGMTGRSGGAAVTWFTASVDPRIKVAAPVMGISTYAANVAADTQQHHCDCMFPINFHRHDMMHQGALIAPRPLLMAHGKLDVLFPVPGYEEFEEKVGALYESYGRRSVFANVVVDTGHKDSDFLRERVIRWFDEHLMGVQERELDLAYTDIPAESLAVFPDGPPGEAQNFRLHETFISTPAFRSFKDLSDWEAHRDELVGKLRERVFFDHTSGSGKTESRLLSDEVENGFVRVQLVSRDGVSILGLLDRREQSEKKRLPGLLYVASSGEDSRTVRSFLQNARQEECVSVVLYPRGIWPDVWEESFQRVVRRNAMHVGRTLDSLRLEDVLQAVDLLRREARVDTSRITIAGKGVSGVLGLYAALLDPEIFQVVLLNPPSSHVEGPVFLNILRYLDIPEAAALLAPRALSFYSRMPSAFESVRDVYSLYGMADQPFVTMDLYSVIGGRYDHAFSSGR